MEKEERERLDGRREGGRKEENERGRRKGRRRN